MLFIIIAAFLLLVAAATALLKIFPASLGAFGLLLLVTIFSSLTTVDARAVGIQTSFGKYTDTLKPGLQFVAPWSSVEEFSTLMQPTDLNDEDGSKGNAVSVAFSAPKDPANPNAKQVAGGGNGVLSGIVNWRISTESGPAGAKSLWEKWRSFDRVSSELVLSKAQDTFADVANDFPAGEASVNQTGMGVEIKNRLQAILRPYGIVVEDVSIKKVTLDAATQASLQKIVDNINRTTAYAEEEKASAIQNRILKDREAAGALSEKANSRYCLDIVKSWNAAEQGQLPATFNCGMTTGNAGVLVSAK